MKQVKINNPHDLTRLILDNRISNEDKENLISECLQMRINVRVHGFSIVEFYATKINQLHYKFNNPEAHPVLWAFTGLSHYDPISKEMILEMEVIQAEYNKNRENFKFPKWMHEYIFNPKFLTNEQF